MTLDLSAYKPVDNTTTDADAISEAFTTLETWGNALPTSTTPSGIIVPYAGTASPSGWFVCDGSAVSRVTYASLFSAIGTAYGVGDGSTTFNLPDMRGRVGVGYAAAGGHTDVSTLGLNDGTTLSGRRPKHRTSSTLSLVDGHHSHPFVTGNGNSGTGHAATTADASFDTAATDSVAANVSLTGGVGTGVSTDPLDAPAYLVVNYLIKT